MLSIKKTFLILVAFTTFAMILNTNLKSTIFSPLIIRQFGGPKFLNINSTLNATLTHVTPSSVEPVISNDYKLSLERRLDCNLRTPDNCHRTNKSLVISFWGQNSDRRWLINNFLSVFPAKYFDYIIMVYDKSNWTHHPIYERAIWIHVRSQIRFWYIKRFVVPHILRTYRYVWIVDDDARFDFNTRAYECVVNQFNILLSSPARLTGPISYLITRISTYHSARIGRWTDFVESGPLVIANSSALACLWNYISEKVSSGYGLDLIWCRILSAQCFPQYPISKVCAILDTFAVDHDATGINSVDSGTAELPAYDKYYQNYKTKRLIFGAIGNDSSAFDMCAKKLSTNQSFIL